MKLNRREKFSIYTAAVALFVFVLVQFYVFPLIDMRKRLKSNIRIKTHMLGQMLALQSEYEAITRKARLSNSRVAKRQKGFTLFSFLDMLAGETKVKDHITYMKPSTSTQKNSPIKISKVEMKLQAITVKQLAAYLHRVETSKNIVTVKRLSISKTGKEKEEGFIDAVLQVETFEI